MHASSRTTPGARISRTGLLLLFGWPQLLIVVPLAVGLTCHAVSGWMRLEPHHGWQPMEVARAACFAVALAAFVVIAVVNLVGVIYSGWNGDGAGSGATDANRKSGSP